MASITIHSDFGAQKLKSVTVTIVSPSICPHELMGLDAMILVFWSWVFSQLFHSSLSPSSRDSLVLLHFLPLEWYHLHIWGCWYFSSNFDSSLCFILSGIYNDILWLKLKKKSDDIQSCPTPFLIFNQSVFPCLVLTVASWSACRFLRSQVRWSGIHISLRIFHSLLWYTQSKAFE